MIALVFGGALRIHSVDYRGSFVDGPGIRSLLFVQGCDRHCAGCHNKSTWDLFGGYEIGINELAENIKCNCANRKLTITGGEPLLQYEDLIALITELNGFDICVYTGFEENEVPDSLFEIIDYIKVGAYDANLKITTEPYIGSTNQKFIRNLRKNEKESCQ